MKENTWYLFLSVCWLHLKDALYSIHFFPSGDKVHCFHTQVKVAVLYFIYPSSADGHLCWFHNSAIGNSVTQAKVCKHLRCILTSFPLGIPKHGRASWSGNSSFNFWGASYCFPQWLQLINMATNNVPSPSSTPKCLVLAQHVFAFLVTALLTSVRWNLSAVLICIFLRAKDAEHFFPCICWPRNRDLKEVIKLKLIH